MHRTNPGPRPNFKKPRARMLHFGWRRALTAAKGVEDAGSRPHCEGLPDPLASIRSGVEPQTDSRARSLLAQNADQAGFHCSCGRLRSGEIRTCFATPLRKKASSIGLREWGLWHSRSSAIPWSVLAPRPACSATQSDCYCALMACGRRPRFGHFQEPAGTAGCRAGSIAGGTLRSRRNQVERIKGKLEAFVPEEDCTQQKAMNDLHRSRRQHERVRSLASRLWHEGEYGGVNHAAS